MGLGHPIYTGRHIGNGRPYVRNGGIAVTVPGSGGAAAALGGGGNGRVSLPPLGEQRFVPDEVVVEFFTNTSQPAIAQLTRRYNLSTVESQRFPLIGTTLYRLHIGSGRSVRSTLATLRNQGIVAEAQPNYLFALQEDNNQTATAAAGDPVQYVLTKLQVAQAQMIATGKEVPVAVIDSEIDANHPDLGGSIGKAFDALGGPETPQLHGTEMAGAIASHGKLLGIAPGVELLAARAFDGHSGGTSFAIYKSLQWAADNGARVVNMSFAGPEDPTMHRLLAAASAKSIVLVAAAGNAGAQSAPLYPAADPAVIAVTATDVDDHLFKMSNRGRYITLAAPGVDILALAPNDAYGITTGTSVAAAHVSGIVALLLQHDPALTPADIRGILAGTAKPVDLAGQNELSDPGLVNAYRAVTAPVKSIATDVSREQAKR
jgi:subtilisin family serine protease